VILDVLGLGYLEKSCEHTDGQRWWPVHDTSDTYNRRNFYFL